MHVRDVSRLKIKNLQTIQFGPCQNNNCPKKKDYVSPKLAQSIRKEFVRDFNPKGCEEIKTVILGISDEAQSDEDWQRAPLIGVVLPSPDPTGALGLGGRIGVSRDIILESLWRVSKEPALRVAFFFVTRGYSINPKPYKGDLLQGKINPAAISFCSRFLFEEIHAIRPDKLLLCGPEVGGIFFSERFTVPDFRRDLNRSVVLSGVRYPVQVTFNPYICTGQPAYLKTIWEDCEKLLHPPKRMPKKRSHVIRTLTEALEYLDYLATFDDFIAIDYETENLNRTGNNRVATIQFATSTEEAYVLPIHHKESPLTPDELELIMAKLRDLFGGKIKSCGWVAHGAKFENTISQLHFGTMLVSAPIYDTQALFFCLDETRTERKADIPTLKGRMGPFTLKLLAKDFLHFYEYDEDILAAREDGALFDMPLERLADYGGMDAYVTLALLHRGFEIAAEQDYLEQCLKMCRLYYGPATLLAAEVETNGFKVDLKRARELSANKGPFNVLLKELEEKLKEFKLVQDANIILASQLNAGQPKGVLGRVPWVIDFSKPEHQQLLFFNCGGFEPVSWSDKTGRASVDKDFFKAYRNEHPVVEIFAQYVETKKLRDTFVAKIIERIDPQTGTEDSRKDQRIRPGIQYAQLVTGRWAMTKPNLQQLPRVEEKTDESTGKFYVRKSIKDLFTVDRNCGLIQVDYKVNEVRWAAILAQDPVMAEIFNRAAKQLKYALETGNLDDMALAELMEDIHRNTAAEAFGVPLDQVTKRQRQAAKNITFGILFGQGIEAIAQAIGATEDEAAEFQAKFFSRMKGIENFINDMKYSAQTRGYVEAPHGRRRRFWSYYLPDMYYGKKKWAARNERQSVNSPIQGIASDASMVGGAYNLMRFIKRNGLDWKIQNLVHDSCIFQTPMDEVQDAIMVMESIFVEDAMNHMEQMGVRFNLPLGIDVEAGHIFWGSLEKWKGTEEHAEVLQQKVIDIWANR